MRITNNERTPKILGKFKLSLILALVVILPLSALMAGLLNSRNATSTLGNNSVQQQVEDGNTAVSRDYSELAGKYIGLFVANDNGTVTLDIGNKANRAVIEDEDLQALQEYAEMIENVNALVEDGTLYIAEDGNYYMVENDAANNLSRGLDGGKNEFYVRTQEFPFLWFSVWLPVGFHLSLGSIGAITFGAVTGFLTLTNAYSVVLEGRANVIKKIRNWVAFAAWGFLEANTELIFGILYGIYVLGMAIDVAIAASTAGIGTIIKTIVHVILAIIGSFIFENIGKDFLFQGLSNTIREENTVVVDTNLLLQNKNLRVEKH